MCSNARYNGARCPGTMNFLDRLDTAAKQIERFLSGGAVADPLYISNRTIGQRIRMALLVGIPAVAVAALVVWGMSTYFESRGSSGAASHTDDAARAVTAKLLPNIEKNFTTDYSRDVNIVEAAISTGNERILFGKIRNNTDRVVQVAEAVFELTNDDGSELGGVVVTVRNIAPKATAPFKLALTQRNARSVMVRELHSR
jgi:hypothetical protein